MTLCHWQVSLFISVQRLFYSIHTHPIRGEGGENGGTAWTDLKEQILWAHVMA